MVSSYEEKVIIKYLRIKYKYGAARIVSNHPEQELNVNGVKELLNKIDGAGDIVWKVFKWPKSVCTSRWTSRSDS